VADGGQTPDGEVEVLFHPRDGDAVRMLARESVFRAADDTVLGLLLRLTPSQEQKSVTEALEESRAKLAEAQRIARMGGWSWDVDADLIEASEEYIHTFGFEPDFFPVDLATYSTIIHPDDREEVGVQTERMLRTGEPFEMTLRIGGDEQGWTWALARGVGKHGPDGRVVRVEGTLQDVTQATETELALRDQVAQNGILKAVASAANEASTLDELLVQSKHLVLLHDDWERARGFRCVDGELEPIYVEEADLRADLAAPDVLEADLALARQVVEQGDLVWDDARLTIAFPVHVRDRLLAVLAITSAPPLYRHAMIEDFVRQVSAQMSQVALREEVARQMEEARDAAMAASQQKSDFLAMVSHEIRTPLNGVIGLNELLLRTDLDEEQRKLATGAGLSGRLLLSLINDILDFSKIEAGQLALEHLDFQVREMFEQLIGAHGEAADQKGVTLEVQYGDDLPDVLSGDPTRLAQVVNNLVSNAVKFTDAGSVVVRVRASRDGGDERDAWLLRCEVEDTGVGVEPGLDELFEPFQQADSSTSRRFGGTGLGLAISRELVTLAGGEIGYDSVPGQGSTFWFTMRMADSTGTMASDTRPTPSWQAHGPSRRVLLVEDNPVNRMVAAGILQALGHEADTAEDGIVALGLLQEHRYDAVLLDVQMPRMDGYATARAIREGERHSGASRLPIIALTAAAVDGERERCLQAGMDDFLTKPVDPDALSATLHRWLQAAEPAHLNEHQTIPAPTTERPMAPDLEPHLDLGRIRMLRDLVPSSTAYLDRAIDNFLRNTPATEETLRRAVAEQDADALRFHAHSLKGSASNLGLTRVAEAAEQLQAIGDAGEVEGADAVLAELAELLEAGRAALLAQRESGYADPAPSDLDELDEWRGRRPSADDRPDEGQSRVR
jgi:signal transduction histidine kinase/DNA-binding NarL/FixJ family response regulator/HPt (histidine-containing phosphotransfer) domain-containing protein